MKKMNTFEANPGHHEKRIAGFDFFPILFTLSQLLNLLGLTKKPPQEI